MIASTEAARSYPDTWLETAERLGASRGTVMLLGATDTGKTTFAGLLGQAACGSKRPFVLVDADLGQSEVGPPACIGSRSAGEADLLFFVGSTSPGGATIEHLTALDDCMVHARERGDLVILDTTGFISGSLGQRLKLAEISIAKPRFAVAFQLTRECEHILRALDRRENLEVIRLPALPPSARRSSSLRTQRREGQFARYFSGAGMASIRMADVALTRTWIGRSPSLPLIAQRFIAKSSGARVLHAEFFEGHLGVVCAEPPSDDKDLAGLQEEFRAERITFSPVAQYRHLLVGLMDHNSKTLAMGLLETLDLKEGLAAVITPLRAVSAVRRIDFGLLRVQPNGRELGSVRSGSL